MKTMTYLACFVTLTAVCGGAPLAQTLGPITFNIQDSEGTPVPDAEVHCVNWENEIIRKAPLQDGEKGVTDAEGRVTFQDKTIGQVFTRVVAGDQGGWFRVHDQGEHPEVTLTAGTGHTLRGGVRDVNGEPMAGVQILADGCLPVTVTDDAGRFAVPNTGVTYSPELVFAKEGYATEGTHVHFDANEVTITMKRAVDVPVRVVYPDGTPAAEVNAGGSVRWSRYLRTDRDGHFTITGAPVGDEIGISATARRDDTTYRGDQRFVVPPDPPDVVTLALEPVHFATVSGQFVHVDTREPVIGRVFLDTQNEFYSPRERGHTDEEGRFSFENIWPGHYWIFAAPTKPMLYQVGGPQQVRIDEDGGDVTVEIAIDEGCAIRGTVLTAAGEPVERCQVMWRPMPHYRAIWTDKAGHFVLPHLDGVGLTYTIEVSDRFQRIAKATVGPMEKGQIVSGVELRLPAAMEPAVLRGSVVDPSGEPLANVRLSFTYDEGVEPRSLSATTDESGQFEVNVVNSGAVSVRASRGVQIQRERGSDNISVECEIVGPDTVQLSAEHDGTLEFVVKPKTLRMLTGKVTDPAGLPVKANVQVLYGEYKSDSGNSGGSEGEFMFRRLPEETFVLEVTARGYKARILKADELEFSPARPFAVTLEPGPFAIGESVWASVTGTPPTPESVAQFPLADRIRKSEWQYYEQAKQPEPPKSPSVGIRYSHQKSLRVVDVDGNPVKRIFLETLYSMPEPETVLYGAGSGQPPQTLTSADGIYQPIIDYGAIVSSPDFARVLVKSEWSDKPSTSIDVVLEKPASLELRVKDDQDDAAAGVPIYMGKMAWDHEANARAYHLGDTDSEGVLRFDRLAPGFHGLAVGQMGSTMQLILVRVKPGESRTEEITLTGDVTSEPRVRLQHWREKLRDEGRRVGYNEDLFASAGELPASEKRRIAQTVRETLTLLPNEMGWGGWLARELRLCTLLAVTSGDKSIVPLLKERLTNLVSSRQGGLYWGRPETASAIAEAIIALDGGKPVDFFAKLAGDSARDRAVRLASLLALGQIATPESAEAFAMLRDSAYGAPNAPARRDSYTHAERMAETAHVVLWVLSGDETARAFDPLAYSGASVSEDYTTGTLNTTTFGGWTGLRFRRVGNEWLLTEVGGTVVT